MGMFVEITGRYIVFVVDAQSTANSLIPRPLPRLHCQYNAALMLHVDDEETASEMGKWNSKKEQGHGHKQLRNELKNACVVDCSKTKEHGSWRCNNSLNMINQE